MQLDEFRMTEVVRLDREFSRTICKKCKQVLTTKSDTEIPFTLRCFFFLIFPKVSFRISAYSSDFLNLFGVIE